MPHFGAIFQEEDDDTSPGGFSTEGVGPLPLPALPMAGALADDRIAADIGALVGVGPRPPVPGPPGSEDLLEAGVPAALRTSGEAPKGVAMWVMRPAAAPAKRQVLLLRLQPA